MRHMFFLSSLSLRDVFPISTTNCILVVWLSLARITTSFKQGVKKTFGSDFSAVSDTWWLSVLLQYLLHTSSPLPTVWSHIQIPPHVTNFLWVDPIFAGQIHHLLHTQIVISWFDSRFVFHIAMSSGYFMGFGSHDSMSLHNHCKWVFRGS